METFSRLRSEVHARGFLLQPRVLVLWGRHDKILPPETAQKFADALPSATVQLFL